MSHLKKTRRAYTMRLTGSDPQDTSWSEALWKTHLAVNQGAKIFGDWLLTFRGGIPAELANDNNLPGDLAHRRNILALSWLSVEDREGSPQGYQLPEEEKPLDTLEKILNEQDVPKDQIKEWLEHCEGSLKANIRKDAVWVNRLRCFKDRQQEVSITPEDVEDFLIHFFGSWKAYFEPSNTDEKEDAKDLVIKAGHWLSGRFGSGQGANYELFAKIYTAILNWTSEDIPINLSGIEVIDHLAKYMNAQQIPVTGIEDILSQLSGPGYKSGTKILLQKLHQQQKVSEDDIKRLAEKVEQDRDKAAEKIGKKGSRPYAEVLLTKIESEVGFPYKSEGTSSNHQEYSVLLDHAARRVSQTHSWVKRAEAARKIFEEDAKKIQDVPEQAKEWLDQYRISRAKQSGRSEEYFIRKGAISAWEKVLKKWQDCTDEESRIEAAKMLQDDDTIDKFGDVNLFITLASEEARCVWEQDGKVTPDILKKYVDAAVAQHDQQRFKVPAYRHPDPLKHPVFVEFGNSRWSVGYEAHRAVQAQDKKKKSKAQEDLDSQKITLTLWDGSILQPIPLRWQGKRFLSEVLGSNFDPAQAADSALLGISRKTRFGKATLGINEPNGVLRTLEVFSEENWNARLQVDREMLEKLDRLQKKYGKEDQRVKNLIQRLPWFVSMTANLQPTGIWERYIENLDPKAQEAFLRERNGQEFLSYTGWPHQRLNDLRGGSGSSSNKLMLCRLPNLRVLSVDLGIRYGASCTVWETLSVDNMKQYCDEHGSSHPRQDDLYYTIHTDKKRKLFFRRIAGDTLLDGTTHPAPWARLERQFFIKLQGEEKPSRKPSPDEYQWFENLEKQLGMFQDSGKKPLHISTLHWEALAIVKKASKHHNQIAIIAHNIAKPVRFLPGGRPEELLPDKRPIWVEQVAQALNDLWSLKHQRQPYYQEVKAIWENHVEPLPFSELKEEFSEELLVNENNEGMTRKARKEKSAEKIKKLNPVAEYLITNEAQRLSLVDALKDFWKNHDCSHFYPILKDLRKHILPQGGKNRKSDQSIRFVGGLSQDRIITITELRRINDAFSKRPTPNNLQANISKRGEQRKGHFSEQKALKTLEQLRENRCKQLASRIVEAALGLGAVKGQTGKRPESPTRYQPCHAIVVERLDHYRPDELRTRRENRNLMNWSSKQIQKYLAESCELYSIHMRPVSPGYTSREDYKTGVGGIRCNDYAPWKFINSSWIQNKIGKAQEKQEKKLNNLTPTEKWLLDLWEHWDSNTETWRDFKGQSWQWDTEIHLWKPLGNPAVRPEILKTWQWDKDIGQWIPISSDKKHPPLQPEPVRVPERGGEIFVSADKNAGSGIHADLNAAANIGLRALKDPDWRGSYWKLTVNTSTGQPDFSKNEESLLSQEIVGSLLPSDTPISNKKNSEKINLFSNPSIVSLSDNTRQWKSYRDYYLGVEQAAVEHIRVASKPTAHVES
ncbi:MAG: type V CRISPR-associated protein Cas12b [Candidatus Melainabacteria bacterium]|nr:type V CRISPR-associated protein Cas12b [Candidatus Melainabacteria bacterium]